MNIDYLILGLGNPGKKYEKTRHNIGWWVAESIIEKYNGKMNRISQIVDFSLINIGEKNIVIAMPLTYMNLSGIAAKYMLNKYELLSEQMLTIVDEYNFPVGKIHIKSSGSAGGHNGIASIIDELGTSDFFRLRCGIDRNFGQGELVDYVLSNFLDNERSSVNSMISNAVKAIETFISNDSGKAMSQINSAQS